MKEEDLRKAIKLKEDLDSERELLRFANHPSVDLRVNLEERCDHGRIRNMVIANIEKNISNLLDKLEKL